jgi:hypothetical protein
VTAEPVGRRTSHALTEARTVLSRAETGAWSLRRRAADDPEAAAIVEALEGVVELLEPFRRTGRPRS